jgi:hypothetical protein
MEAIAGLLILYPILVIYFVVISLVATVKLGAILNLLRKAEQRAQRAGR